MKYCILFLLPLFILFFSACASFPDVPLAVIEPALLTGPIEKQHPTRLYFDTTLDSDGHEAFYVDDLPGPANKYTDSHGKVYNMTELLQMAYILPPDTYGAIQIFTQQYCHQNNGVGCNGVGQWFGSSSETELTSRVKVNRQSILNTRLN